MPSLRNVLCAAAVAGLIFSPSAAEARFGKRSSSSSSTKKEKKSKVHDATAVGEESSSDDDDDDDTSYSSRSSSSSSGAQVVTGVLSLLEHLATPRRVRTTYYVAPELPPERPSSRTVVAPLSDEPAVASAQVSAAAEVNHTGLRFGVNGGAMGGGSSVELFLGIEGERMGLDVRGTRLTLPTDDGTPGTDEITLANLHLTYALVARQNVRLRLEGGLSGAYAPDVSITAPSLALSLEGCLLGALDGEVRAHVVPFPHQQVDLQAGLALRVKALALRGGWRALYLNDQGIVDDVEHMDAFGGPYLGLGLSF
ncbi:MAG: hypothetical protein JXB05_28885 [Myxococcaceae bacterium]|nr:hypothetical protein [Myxococcaceae bacterium]